MSCAIFLAKFESEVAHQYQRNCETSNRRDKHKFHTDIYDASLKEMLDKYSAEDADHHGRLIELKRMLLDIREDGSDQDMDEETEMKFMLNDYRVFIQKKKKTSNGSQGDIELFRKENLYFDDWESLFYEKNTARIETVLLPKIKNEILSKKGIFESEQIYRVLENHFEVLIRQLVRLEQDSSLMHTPTSLKMDSMSKLSSNLTAFGIGSTTSIDLRSNASRVNVDVNPHQMPSNISSKQVSIAETSLLPNLTLKSSSGAKIKYSLDYDISRNSRLMSYFHALVPGLRTLLLCAAPPHCFYYSPNSSTLQEKLKECCKILPKFAKQFTGFAPLLKSQGQNRWEDLDVLYFEVMQFCSNYQSIVSMLAIAMTIVRREVLMSITKLTKHQILDFGGPGVLKVFEQRKLTHQEMLAIGDAKYVEVAFLSLYSSKKLKPRKLLPVSNIRSSHLL